MEVVMKNFIITISKDRFVVDSGDASIVYIFENIAGYEEEVFDLLEQDKISIKDLEVIVDSWGGKIRSVTMKQLLLCYYKNNFS